MGSVATNASTCRDHSVRFSTGGSPGGRRLPNEARRSSCRTSAAGADDPVPSRVSTRRGTAWMSFFLGKRQARFVIDETDGVLHTPALPRRSTARAKRRHTGRRDPKRGKSRMRLDKRRTILRGAQMSWPRTRTPEPIAESRSLCISRAHLTKVVYLLGEAGSSKRCGTIRRNACRRADGSGDPCWRGRAPHGSAARRVGLRASEQLRSPCCR